MHVHILTLFAEKARLTLGVFSSAETAQLAKEKIGLAYSTSVELQIVEYPVYDNLVQFLEE